MNDPSTCIDKERLITYLFDECDAAERKAVEIHLASCAACASEVAALSGVRADLSAWKPPEEVLGFQVIAPAARPSSRAWWMPAWAQAVAAVLLVAAGAALANVELRFTAGGLVVNTGWHRSASQAPPPAAAAAQPSPSPAGDTPWRTDLAALERQLRSELRAQPVADGGRAIPAASGVPGMTEAQVLARFRSLVQESEDRQRREFAVRLAQAVREIDSQRQADLVRIQSNLGQLEGRTRVEVAGTNEMLRYLMRASQTQIK